MYDKLDIAQIHIEAIGERLQAALDRRRRVFRHAGFLVVPEPCLDHIDQNKIGERAAHVNAYAVAGHLNIIQICK